LPSSVDVDDLVQAGMIGLLEAAASFAADRGATFETYAGIRIRGAMIDTLRQLGEGTASVTAQPADGVTYAKKILAAEARIDWSRPAREILRFIHGLNPAPGAWTMQGETRIKLLKVAAAQGQGVPGTIIGSPLRIACGEGALDIIELQRAGRGAQATEEFLRGYPLASGARFD
jgi:methionyl-tRNA formyltransferase